jgi:hypothetical protein
MATLLNCVRVFVAASLFFVLSARTGSAEEPKAPSTVKENAESALKATPKPVAGTRPETVVDDQGRFLATFPGPVQRGSQQVDTAVGKIAMHMVYFDGGAVAYMVIYSDYPAGSVAQSGGASKVCSNASDGAVKAVKGTVRTSSPCRLGDINGLEIVADLPAKDSSAPAEASIARLRFFVVADRLFQIMYLGPMGKETGREGLAFLDSFRLTR